jgi:hypothetical protein
VDTPGIFDTETDDAIVNKELARCMLEVAPGPHAILFVIRTDVRFTKDEAQVLAEHIIIIIIIIIISSGLMLYFSSLKCVFNIIFFLHRLWTTYVNFLVKK